MRLIGIVLLTFILATPTLGEQLQPSGESRGRLHADHVRYDVKSKVFTADGNVVLMLDSVEVRAARVKFELPSQMMFANGGVTVTQSGVIVTAPQLTYNAHTREAFAQGGVRLVQTGSILTAETMLANLQRKEAEVAGNAMLRASRSMRGPEDKASNPPDQQETTITAPRLTFRWDVHEAQAQGGVVIVQPDKMVRSNQARYSETDGRAVLEGGVVMEQPNGEWLVRNGVVEPPEEPEARKGLASTATLSCDRLVILLKAGDMNAEGNVTVLQKGRSIAGERASYSAKDKRVVMAGNVHIRDSDGSWLRADQAVILLVEGTFEASGNVEAELPAKQKK